MAWVNLNTIYATKSEVNSKVPNTRTINGKALSSNVTLGASDIKLSDDTTLQSAWDSISQANRTTLCNGVTYEVYGKLVIVHAHNITLSGDLRKVGTMPSGLCPRATVYGVINADSYAGIIYVNSNGDVLFWARNKADYTGQIIYTV